MCPKVEKDRKDWKHVIIEFKRRDRKKIEMSDSTYERRHTVSN